jgi:hypothetical protein
VILIGGTVIALLQPAASVTTYLDPGPGGTQATGAHALADLLAGRGDSVITAVSPGAAEADVARAGPRWS